MLIIIEKGLDTVCRKFAEGEAVVVNRYNGVALFDNYGRQTVAPARFRWTKIKGVFFLEIQRTGDFDPDLLDKLRDQTKWVIKHARILTGMDQLIPRICL